MGAIAYLDESKTEGRHRIISVGGFVVEAEQVSEVERRWRDGKTAVGLDPEVAVKHSGDGPDRELRSRLVELIGQLPIMAVIALLEDFRPDSLREDKRTRSELYIHKPAFEYVLQRLVTNYFGAGGGPHFVSFDLRDDFAELSKAFQRWHGRPWRLPYNTLPSMRNIGISSSLMATNGGAANEIATSLSRPSRDGPGPGAWPTPVARPLMRPNLTGAPALSHPCSRPIHAPTSDAASAS